MKRCVAWLLLAMFSVASLGACNTVKGVGKDLEKVGGKMQRKADETGGTAPD
jgi:entericidin A